MGTKRFPLFVDLTGKKALVIGGGTVGLRRAEVLTRFGAEVTVVSPALSREVERIHHIPRKYAPGDLEGAFLAVAAADDPQVNEAAGREARRLGVLFNRSDAPADCDFFFPAVCEGGGMVAGLAGDGTDHGKTARTAKEIRNILENINDET
ncbi:MAG: NAD(P)-dependent oxidoreductase [Oscillospiraceae bacterium]|nr:NAD(P)-dependent oxidoreductase [Oscillospiraceae bacterium]